LSVGGFVRATKGSGEAERVRPGAADAAFQIRHQEDLEARETRGDGRRERGDGLGQVFVEILFAEGERGAEIAGARSERNHLTAVQAGELSELEALKNAGNGHGAQLQLQHSRAVRAVRRFCRQFEARRAAATLASMRMPASRTVGMTGGHLQESRLGPCRSQ